MTGRNMLLEAGNVHVWQFDGAALTPGLVQALNEQLLPDERLSVARFRDARQRDHRAAGRAMLRQVVSAYLDAPAAALAFDVGLHGKPFVRAPEVRGLRFNVSHSDAMTLIAIAQGQEIGIDIERVRRDLPIDALARASFTAEEWNAFERVPEAQRHTAFFRCWTRKEAVLKAEGVGLHRALNSVNVGLGTQSDITRIDAWAVMSLDVAPDYAAAIALEGADIAVTLHSWDPAAAVARVVNPPGL